MVFIFGLLLTVDVFLALALLKLTERVNELAHKVDRVEQVANSKYDTLRKHYDDQYMSLNARYNVHRMFHIMKGDNI